MDELKTSNQNPHQHSVDIYAYNVAVQNPLSFTRKTVIPHQFHVNKLFTTETI